MRIVLRKEPDGNAVLRCTREDGTETWQRHSGPRAAFFPLHDLTHYVVETTLGCRQAFFGLVAAGWPIADTTGTGDSGPLPDEALAVEHLVGLLDLGRAGTHLDVRELNRQAADFAEKSARTPPAPLTEAEYAEISDRLPKLFARWRALPPGSGLDLLFDAAAPRESIEAESAWPPASAE